MIVLCIQYFMVVCLCIFGRLRVINDDNDDDDEDITRPITISTQPLLQLIEIH